MAKDTDWRVRESTSQDTRCSITVFVIWYITSMAVQLGGVGGTLSDESPKDEASLTPSRPSSTSRLVGLRAASLEPLRRVATEQRFFYSLLLLRLLRGSRGNVTHAHTRRARTPRRQTNRIPVCLCHAIPLSALGSLLLRWSRAFSSSVPAKWRADKMEKGTKREKREKGLRLLLPSSLPTLDSSLCRVALHGYTLFSSRSRPFSRSLFSSFSLFLFLFSLFDPPGLCRNFRFIKFFRLALFYTETFFTKSNSFSSFSFFPTRTTLTFIRLLN